MRLCLDVEDVSTQEAEFGFVGTFGVGFCRTVVADDFDPGFKGVHELFHCGKEAVCIQTHQGQYTAECNMLGFGVDGEGCTVGLLEEVLRFQK